MATAKTAKKTIPVFSTEFIDQIKTELLADQTRLTHELNKFAKPNPNNTAAEGDYDTKFPNFGDKDDENAAEVAEYAANLTIEQDLEKLLRDVKATLERIKKGQFGFCKYCKKAIEEKRLRARPTAGACVECKKAITQEL